SKKIPAVTGTWPSSLLARPDDAVHPGNLGQVEAVVLVRRVETLELDAAGRPARELLGHHLTAQGAHHDPVTAPDRRCRRDNDHIAVAKHRFHRIAADLQRGGV